MSESSEKLFDAPLKSTNLETLQTNDPILYSFGTKFKDKLDQIAETTGGEFIFKIDRRSEISEDTMQGMVMSHKDVGSLRVIWNKETEIFELWDIIVDENSRGRGFGTVATNAMESLADELGAKEIHVKSILDTAADYWKSRIDFVYDSEDKSAIKKLN